LKLFLKIKATLPGMWERTVTIGSAGKSFSSTGTKVKYKKLSDFCEMWIKNKNWF
jgi:hypothetical protein